MRQRARRPLARSRPVALRAAAPGARRDLGQRGRGRASGRRAAASRSATSSATGSCTARGQQSLFCRRTTVDEAPAPTARDIEEEASVFAAALLMPQWLFVREHARATATSPRCAARSGARSPPPNAGSRACSAWTPSFAPCCSSGSDERPRRRGQERDRARGRRGRATADRQRVGAGVAEGGHGRGVPRDRPAARRSSSSPRRASRWSWAATAAASPRSRRAWSC